MESFAGTAPTFVRWRCAQYDGIVALAACEHFGRSRRVIPMMVVLLMAGIGLLLAGLLTVGLGIQMDLSFGNTLILTGAIAACTGMIMLSLWAVARELKKIASRLGAGIPLESRAGTAAAPAGPRDQATESRGFPFSRDQREPEDLDNLELEVAAPSSAPWQGEPTGRDRGRKDGAPIPEPVEAAPA